MSTHEKGAGPWHDGELHYQRLAGVPDSGRMRRAIMTEMPAVAMEFVEGGQFAALGTVDDAGSPHAWILVGPRGFLRAPKSTELQVSRAAIEAAGSTLQSQITAQPDVGTLLLEARTRRRMRINGRGRFDDAGDLVVEAHEVFSNCPKYIQTREPESALVHAPSLHIGERRSSLEDADVRLLSAADSFFIASRHVVAGSDVSHRGGRPGFLRVVDERNLRFPDYSGNNMFQTLGNLHLDDRAGIAVPDFKTGELLQLTGRARVDANPSRLNDFEGAKRVLEFTVDSVTHSRWEDFVPWSFGEFSPALPPEAVG